MLGPYSARSYLLFNSKRVSHSLSFIKNIQIDNSSSKFLSIILTKDFLCNIKLKVLSNLLEKYYIYSYQLKLVNIIKDSLDCIPLNIFRYLLLYIANKKSKIKIYYSALIGERMDLLDSIKGLTSKDYKKIYNSLNEPKESKNKVYIYKKYNKSLQNEIKSNNINKKKKKEKIEIMSEWINQIKQ